MRIAIVIFAIGWPLILTAWLFRSCQDYPREPQNCPDGGWGCGP